MVNFFSFYERLFSFLKKFPLSKLSISEYDLLQKSYFPDCRKGSLKIT